MAKSEGCGIQAESFVRRGNGLLQCSVMSDGTVVCTDVVGTLDAPCFSSSSTWEIQGDKNLAIVCSGFTRARHATS